MQYLAYRPMAPYRALPAPTDNLLPSSEARPAHSNAPPLSSLWGTLNSDDTFEASILSYEALTFME